MILKIKIIIALFLVFLISFILVLKLNNDPTLPAKLKLFSLSAGEQYYGRLTLFDYYIKSGDITNAQRLQPFLDPVDTQYYRSQSYPELIQKNFAILQGKSNKTVEDWLELARLQAKLSLLDQAKDSITKAHQLDPIRDDVTDLYYQFSRL